MATRDGPFPAGAALTAHRPPVRSSAGESASDAEERARLSLGAAGTEPPELIEPARRTPVHAETEVLVVGGGPAGAAAAVAAARAGADTMMVERTGQLGGLATGGLIILLLSLDDGNGRQVVRGLCQEVVDRVAARGAAFFPPRDEWGSEDPALLERYRRWGLVWGSTPRRVRYSVAYEPEEFRLALTDMLETAKVRLLLHAWGCEPIIEGVAIDAHGRRSAPGHVTAVTFQSKRGRFAIRARVVIDATGDGDLFAAAGCAHDSERVLPWLWVRMGGVTDVDAALDAGGWFLRSIGEGVVLLPWGATEAIGRKIDATDPVDLTFAELECRRLVMAEIDRLRAEVPAFRHAHVCEIARHIGITESRRLNGAYVLRREDVDRSFEDAIAVTGNWTKCGPLYSIPYRCLRSDELANLLVAGRCISVDHRVHHSTKEIPSCMATGEAAGVAAALAVRRGVSPAALTASEVREHLRRTGAIVDVPA